MKKVWAYILLGILILGGIMVLFSEDDSQFSQESQSSKLKVNVSSQIVKMVDNKCRYFFDIRNNDEKNFSGSVKIDLINQNGDRIWSDTFATSRAMEPTFGTSVYTDANTCPVIIHGNNGISNYKYEVKIDDQIVNIGEGNISSNFENLD